MEQSNQIPQYIIEERNIRNLIRHEQEYSNLIKEYNRSKNPSTFKEIQRKFNILCQGWDTVRLQNIKISK